MNAGIIIFLFTVLPLIALVVTWMIRAILIIQVLLCKPKEIEIWSFIASATYALGRYPESAFTDIQCTLIIKDINTAKKIDALYYKSFILLIVSFICSLILLIFLQKYGIELS